MADFIPRNLTRPVHVGNVTLGGGAPVVVQSMTCTPTVDLGATLEQVTKLAEAGCDVVRVSVPTKEALGSFRDICRESPVPIVADIHFDYRLALAALDAGAAKLRINPGNIGSWDKVDAIIDKAGSHRPYAKRKTGLLGDAIRRAFRIAWIRKHRSFR